MRIDRGWARAGLVVVGAAAVVAGTAPWLLESAAPVRETRAAPKSRLTFEPNRGQTDARALFVARGAGSTTWLTDDGAVFAFSAAKGGAADVLRMRFVGGAATLPTGVEETEEKTNYVRGGGASVLGVPHFAAVECASVYPGVDVRWHGAGDKLEYDVALAPGADASAVRVALEGADEMRLTETGDLAIRFGDRSVLQTSPVAWQEKDGVREPVSAAFVLDGAEYGFRLGDYDRSRAVVIDPVFLPSISWSLYLGGAGTETGNAVVFDDNGTPLATDDSIVVCGSTTSIDFPLGYTGKIPTSYKGGTDAFVAKLDVTGSYVKFATYFGGTDYDEAFDVAVDPVTRFLWLTGQTYSKNFPTFPSAGPGAAFQQTSHGEWEAFVAAVDKDGVQLRFSSYYGGLKNEYGRGIGVTSFKAADGVTSWSDVYVTGFTNTSAPFFPTSYVNTEPAGPPHVNPETQGPAFQPAYGGGANDAFVFHLFAPQSPASYGATHLLSTYLGGLADDRAYDLAVNRVDASHGTFGAFHGEPYVTGYTNSPDFPRSNSVYPSGDSLQNRLGGSSDAFVVRFKSEQANFALAPKWSTFLGGVGFEAGQSIDVDDDGSSAVTGRTDSFDLPRASASQANRRGPDDAFVARILADGFTPDFITYLGGSATEIGNGVAIDRTTHDVYVVGTTESKDLPVTPGEGDNVQTNLCQNKFSDAFFARYGSVPSGFGPVASGVPKIVSYLGGSAFDYGNGVAIFGVTGGVSNVVLVGTTKSADFPRVEPPSELHGASDAFVVKIGSTTTPFYPAGDLVAAPRSPDSVELTWKPNALDATGLEVQRVGGDGAKTAVAVLPTDAKTYVDTGLAADTSYGYAIVALKNDGSLEKSETVHATTLPYPPAAPTELGASVAGSRVSLVWTDRSDDETGFEVQRMVGAAPFSTVATVKAGATSFETTRILSGEETASWRVVAVNRGGSSAPSNEVEARVAPTLLVSLLKGSLADVRVAGGDKFSASGRLAGAETFDPNAQALRIELGSAAAPLVLTVPAGDRGWTAKRGLLTFNSAKSFVGGARFQLVLDAKKGTFALTVSAFDFPQAVSNPVSLGLALGDRAGAASGAWTAKSAGTLVLK